MLEATLFLNMDQNLHCDGKIPINFDLMCLSEIPSRVTAADLRRIFSQFVEAGAFLYFHYRRRPDSTKFRNIKSIDLNIFFRYLKRKRHPKCQKFVVPFAIKPEFTEKLFALFDELWQSDKVINSDRDAHLVKIVQPLNNPSNHSRLSELLEFQPPTWMPQGNVGTISCHFFKLIRKCQLSPKIIKNLQLSFPQNPSTRKYGSVSFDYESVTCRTDDLSTSDDEGFSAKQTVNQPRITFSNPIGNDELSEEWDRFEALHDDPYNVERSANKNLKYESKIELKWEKGGSGLVYYTDEYFWRKHESVRRDEFFDEPASFDWDIDMEHYEDVFDGGEGGLLTRNPAPCDLDSVQLIDLQGVSRQRPARSSARAFTSHYAKRVMMRYGWRPGSRLGKSHKKSLTSNGLLQPISSEGALPPKVRTGFGFRAPKGAVPCVPVPLASPPLAYIRSVFDTPAMVAYRTGQSSLQPHNRLDPETKIKYRSDWVPKKKTVVLTPHATRGFEGINFQPGGVLRPNQ